MNAQEIPLFSTLALYAYTYNLFIILVLIVIVFLKGSLWSHTAELIHIQILRLFLTVLLEMSELNVLKQLAPDIGY